MINNDTRSKLFKKKEVTSGYGMFNIALDIRLNVAPHDATASQMID